MEALQITWYLLVGVLIAGYAVLDGFDLGVGTLHLILAKGDRERRILMNAIGPVWDGNEVWILTGGGALFAAFPPVYATVFSGLYLALMILLAALIARAVSLEFRSKDESPAWRAAWDVAFSLGSFLPALLFGVAIGNVARGLPLDAEGEFAGTFLGLLNPFALATGLMAVAMFTMQGAAWLLLKTEGALKERARRAAGIAWGAFAALWFLVTILSLGTPHLWTSARHPLSWAVPALLFAALAAFPFLLRKERGGPAFFASSAAVALVVALLGQSLYPNLVPALGDPARSLTLFNSSSSLLTLKAMLAIALVGVPAVLGYTVFVYSRFRGPVVLDETSY